VVPNERPPTSRHRQTEDYSMTQNHDPGSEELISEFIERERAPHREPRVRVTGLLVQYYHVCKRELWFTSRGIDIDRSAANIRRGTHIDETSYRDNRRSFQINGRIALDMLDSGEGDGGQSLVDAGKTCADAVALLPLVSRPNPRHPTGRCTGVSCRTNTRGGQPHRGQRSRRRRNDPWHHRRSRER